MSSEKTIITIHSYLPGDAASGNELLGIATIIIAVLALAASFYFGWLQRRHFRLSSKALLDFNYATSGTLLELENHGFGPAVLKEFTAKVDGGKRLNLMKSAGLQAYAKALLRGIPGVGDQQIATLSKDTIIGPGRKYPIIFIVRAFNQAEQDLIYANFKTITVRANYQCIYGEKLVAKLRGFS